MQDTIWNKHYFTSELSSIFERISFALHKDPKRGLGEGKDEDGGEGKDEDGGGREGEGSLFGISI